MSRLKELIIRHYKERFLLYFLLILCLMVGISAGAITIKVLNSTQKQELISFLDSFFRILNSQDIDSFLLLKQSIVNNLQTVLIIWILSITVIGVPFILGVLALRGFVIGFTTGFLVSELGFKGFLFSILAILPQNIFVIPGLIIVSAYGISFSTLVIKSRFKRNIRFNYYRQLIEYTSSTILFLLIIIIGSVVESYITPVFMKLISEYVV